MAFQAIVRRSCQLLLALSLMGTGLAMAQAEPTLNQVYTTAQSGKIDDAQTMIQQVLISHPNSGRAHFVRAELFARQGKLALARESLVNAEKFAPGLPFAKPAAVQALRLQLAGNSVGNSAGRAIDRPQVSTAAPLAPLQSTPALSWLLPLLLAGGVIAGGYFLFRRKAPTTAALQPRYEPQGGLSGPQSFGIGNGVGPGGSPVQPGNAQGAYPPGAYPQPAGSGLGGRIMGGVATGLAVGAGVMAAEAIGKTLMGGHTSAGAANPMDNAPALDTNRDMGGADFGINDTGSWDDAGSSDVGGSDWDN